MMTKSIFSTTVIYKICYIEWNMNYTIICNKSQAYYVDVILTGYLHWHHELHQDERIQVGYNSDHKVTPYCTPWNDVPDVIGQFSFLFIVLRLNSN